jgi:hypothetical protein
MVAGDVVTAQLYRNSGAAAGYTTGQIDSHVEGVVTDNSVNQYLTRAILDEEGGRIRIASGTLKLTCAQSIRHPEARPESETPQDQPRKTCRRDPGCAVLRPGRDWPGY